MAELRAFTRATRVFLCPACSQPVPAILQIEMQTPETVELDVNSPVLTPVRPRTITTRAKVVGFKLEHDCTTTDQPELKETRDARL